MRPRTSKVSKASLSNSELRAVDKIRAFQAHALSGRHPDGIFAAMGDGHLVTVRPLSRNAYGRKSLPKAICKHLGREPVAEVLEVLVREEGASAFPSVEVEAEVNMGGLNHAGLFETDLHLSGDNPQERGSSL
jgi:hypothetical protein